MAETQGKVGRVLIDAVCYGISKALADMGLQGQVMLNRMGDELLKYLEEKGYIKSSPDQNQMMEQITKFFMDQGFLAGVQLNPSGQEVRVTHEGWSIFDSVGQLSKMASPLQPCPHCLVVTSLMRTGGLYVQYGGSQILDAERKDIQIILRFLKREFDEEKIEKALEGGG